MSFEKQKNLILGWRYVFLGECENRCLNSRLLGDELFRDEVMSRLDEAEEKHSMIKKPGIAELALTVAQEMKVPIGDITGCFENRPVSLARHVLMVAVVLQ